MAKEGIVLENGLADLEKNFSEIGIDDIITQLKKGEIVLIDTRNENVFGKVVDVVNRDVYVKFIQEFKYMSDSIIAAQKEGLKFRLVIKGRIIEEHKDSSGSRIIDRIEILSTDITPKFIEEDKI